MIIIVYLTDSWTDKASQLIKTHYIHKPNITHRFVISMFVGGQSLCTSLPHIKDYISESYQDMASPLSVPFVLSWASQHLIFVMASEVLGPAPVARSRHPFIAPGDVLLRPSPTSLAIPSSPRTQSAVAELLLHVGHPSSFQLLPARPAALTLSPRFIFQPVPA